VLHKMATAASPTARLVNWLPVWFRFRSLCFKISCSRLSDLVVEVKFMSHSSFVLL